MPCWLYVRSGWLRIDPTCGCCQNLISHKTLGCIAGTSANAGLKLYGEDGHTPNIHLMKLGVFQRNSQDVVLVASENQLGELWKV